MSIPTYSLAEAKEDIKELDDLIHLYVLLKAEIELHSERGTPEEQKKARSDLALELSAIIQAGFDITLKLRTSDSSSIS